MREPLAIRAKWAIARGLFRGAMLVAAFIVLAFAWFDDADWINWGLEVNSDLLKRFRQFLEYLYISRKTGARLESFFGFFNVNRVLFVLEVSAVLILAVLGLREILRSLARFLRRRSRRRK